MAGNRDRFRLSRLADSAGILAQRHLTRAAFPSRLRHETVAHAQCTPLYSRAAATAFHRLPGRGVRGLCGRSRRRGELLLIAACAKLRVNRAFARSITSIDLAFARRSRVQWNPRGASANSRAAGPRVPLRLRAAPQKLARANLADTPPQASRRASISPDAAGQPDRRIRRPMPVRV